MKIFWKNKKLLNKKPCKRNNMLLSVWKQLQKLKAQKNSSKKEKNNSLSQHFRKKLHRKDKITPKIITQNKVVVTLIKQQKRRHIIRKNNSKNRKLIFSQNNLNKSIKIGIKKKKRNLKSIWKNKMKKKEILL